jgi:hypothetical protein
MFPLGVKLSGPEADHLQLVPRSKNAWRYNTSLPQYAFMARCLVKHRDNFTFDLTHSPHDILLLSLAPQPSLGLVLLHKIRLNFLDASQKFSFLQGRVFTPRPTPIPEDQASVFISPRGRVATHFSRMGYSDTILIPRSPHGEVSRHKCFKSADCSIVSIHSNIWSDWFNSFEEVLQLYFLTVWLNLQKAFCNLYSDSAVIIRSSANKREM